MVEESFSFFLLLLSVHEWIKYRKKILERWRFFFVDDRKQTHEQEVSENSKEILSSWRMRKSNITRVRLTFFFFFTCTRWVGLVRNSNLEVSTFFLLSVSFRLWGCGESNKNRDFSLWSFPASSLRLFFAQLSWLIIVSETFSFVSAETLTPHHFHFHDQSNRHFRKLSVEIFTIQ